MTLLLMLLPWRRRRCWNDTLSAHISANGHQTSMRSLYDQIRSARAVCQGIKSLWVLRTPDDFDTCVALTRFTFLLRPSPLNLGSRMTFVDSCPVLRTSCGLDFRLYFSASMKSSVFTVDIIPHAHPHPSAILSVSAHWTAHAAISLLRSLFLSMLFECIIIFIKCDRRF